MKRDLILGAVALTLGFVVGYLANQRTGAQSDDSSGAALNAVVSAGDAVIVLDYLEAGAAEKIRSFHAARLRTSVRSAHELLSAAGPIDVPMVELNEYAGRVAEYTASNAEFADLRESAADIQHRLKELTTDAL